MTRLNPLACAPNPSGNPHHLIVLRRVARFRYPFAGTEEWFDLVLLAEVGCRDGARNNAGNRGAGAAVRHHENCSQSTRSRDRTEAACGEDLFFMVTSFLVEL